jgi:hypothetical protein
MSERSELVYEFKLSELLIIEEGKLTALRLGEFWHLSFEELISLGGTLMVFCLCYSVSARGGHVAAGSRFGRINQTSVAPLARTQQCMESPVCP